MNFDTTHINIEKSLLKCYKKTTPVHILYSENKIVLLGLPLFFSFILILPFAIYFIMNDNDPLKSGVSLIVMLCLLGMRVLQIKNKQRCILKGKGFNQSKDFKGNLNRLRVESLYNILRSQGLLKRKENQQLIGALIEFCNERIEHYHKNIPTVIAVITFITSPLWGISVTDFFAQPMSSERTFIFIFFLVLIVVLFLILYGTLDLICNRKTAYFQEMKYLLSQIQVLENLKDHDDHEVVKKVFILRILRRCRRSRRNTISYKE